MLGGNDRECVIFVAMKTTLVMCSAPIFDARIYRHTEHSIGFTQFDASEDAFIVPFPVSLLEEASGVGLARLITLCDSDSVVSPFAVKGIVKIDWSHYVGDRLPYLVYEFETEAVSDIFTTQAPRRSRESGELLLYAPGCEVSWLNVTSYESIKGCGLEFK